MMSREAIMAMVEAGDSLGLVQCSDVPAWRQLSYIVARSHGLVT